MWGFDEWWNAGIVLRIVLATQQGLHKYLPWLSWELGNWESKGLYLESGWLISMTRSKSLSIVLEQSHYFIPMGHRHIILCNICEVKQVEKHCLAGSSLPFNSWSLNLQILRPQYLRPWVHVIPQYLLFFYAVSLNVFCLLSIESWLWGS